MTASKQETQWVLRAQCHDREALECLLRSVQPALYGYVRGLVGAFHAEDVLQDVLILVYRNLAWLRTPELFRPWAFRIASRAAFRHLGKEQRRTGQETGVEVPLEELPAPPVTNPAEVLQDLLEPGKLPPASRAVLVLHFEQQLPLAEVAAVLEIPLGTVKSRLAAGLAALRSRHR